MAITRLGGWGGPRMPFGSFEGKTTAVVPLGSSGVRRLEQSRLPVTLPVTTADIGRAVEIARLASIPVDAPHEKYTPGQLLDADGRIVRSKKKARKAARPPAERPIPQDYAAAYEAAARDIELIALLRAEDARRQRMMAILLAIYDTELEVAA